ncbi:MAG: LysM peptidoglycan-binding domain-containing M23 family metallopeptidase [Anaerolineales bacterium]|nr:LysM peptidoglycan-binding domain-containing M23 family metallopeptidase [Anaerolineales bacterium]
MTDDTPAASGRSWKGGLPYLLAVLGLSAAAWAIALNLGGLQPAAAQPAAEPAPAEVALPGFSQAGRDLAIGRRSLLETDAPVRSRVDMLLYTVQKGDSVFGIADKFSIKPETILWGNLETLNDDPHVIQAGMELRILPVDGAYHEWKSGDSLEAIAKEFGVDLATILEWPSNRIDETMAVAEGAGLIIPGGSRPLRSWFIPTIARGSAGVGSAYGAGGCSGDFSSGAVGTGGFIWPSANHFTSGNDYWSGHLAIDIAGALGDPIWAADGGVVVYSGWSNGGYGNMVMIDHGTGWQTVYAHLSDTRVACGQSVGQGQVIGHMGSTGNSTGTHLHFETRLQGGFVSPWSVLP